MSYRPSVLITFLLMIFLNSYSQKFTISGYIKDQESSESLIGATVVNIKTGAGSAANNSGFYSLTLPGDSVSVMCNYVGYEPSVLKFKLATDTVLNFLLKSSTLLDDVIISAAKGDEIHEINRMSTTTIPVDQIKALPAFLGEVDVLKVIQLMPGVKSGEGSTGLYVRGGGPDQNLILLDGVPVYNASHLFGFFSVFNADAINKVDLIKGGFPARYGGRLSSVIDINMKDGNMKKIHGEGSVGIIAAKATIEGPIVKDKTSFIISGRRTYIDALATPLIKHISEGDRVGYYFYDVNTKINHIINNRNRIYLSNYMGSDKAYANYSSSYGDTTFTTTSTDNAGLKWGNIITAFRWNSVISPKLFANLTATYSRYRFDVFNRHEQHTVPEGIDEDKVYKNEYVSGIRDWAAKLDFDYIPGPNHFIRFGVNSIWHKFTPGVYTYRSDAERDTTIGFKPIHANEISLYAEDDIRLGNNLKINVGAHASGFNVDSHWYTSIQPRISSRYLLGNELSLKASYATMTQFIHLLTNAGLGLPTDLWVPSTARVKPQQANQWALGIAKTYKSAYEISLEGYYKTMHNLIEYKDGASFADVEKDWQDKVAVNGRGESYGAEILLQKKKGNLSGWIGYTLSWTNRQFDNLNFGKWYPYKYDRRHDLSVALTHTWNERMDFSMAWVYGTGNAFTLPKSQYEGFPNNGNYYNGFGDAVGGNNYGTSSQLNYYGNRNDYRMKSYHRLDLSFSFWKNTKWGQRKWTIAVYNAYNRRNPFYIELGYDKKGHRKFYQYSLFPIIPSISYSFKF